MGFKYLAAGRVIVPSVRMLRADAPADYPELFRVAQHDPQLDEVLTRLEIAAGRITAHRLRRLRCALVFSLTSQGVGLQDLTPAGLLHYSEQLRQAIKAPSKALAGTCMGLLLEMGIFPAGTPATMRLAQRGGQRTITEMVDAYGVRNLAVRQLLIDYISHRAVAGMDYTTSVSLTCNLVRNFWCFIQDINPAQADLRPRTKADRQRLARPLSTPSSNRDGTVRPRGATCVSDPHDGPRPLPRPAKLGRRRPRSMGRMGRSPARSPPPRPARINPARRRLSESGWLTEPGCAVVSFPRRLRHRSTAGTYKQCHAAARGAAAGSPAAEGTGRDPGRRR